MVALSGGMQVGVLFKNTEDRALADRLSQDFATVAVPTANFRRVLAQKGIGVLVADIDTVFAERGLAGRLSRAIEGVRVVLIADQHSQDVLDLALKLNGARIVERRVASEELTRIVEQEVSGGSRDVIHTSSLELIGESPSIRRTRKIIANMAAAQSTVLISGEPGSGKTLAAQLIHHLSPQRGEPFRVVACGAADEAALDAELFDARTGLLSLVTTERVGAVLLDEVDALPLGLQAKLLAVLRQRGIYYAATPPGPRIIASTVQSTEPDDPDGGLDAAVRRRDFMRDLYDRLTELRLEMPPLRERRTDVRLLWEHFVGGHRTATPRALMRLAGHDWPGNVRELQNVARFAVGQAGAQRIDEQHLPTSLVPSHEPTAVPMARVPGMTLDELERTAILLTYQSLGENAQATANALGISVRKVHYRLRRYREEGWLSGGAEPAPLPTANDDVQSPSEPRHLLLAEDDDELRWSLTKLLEADGYLVTAVASGTEVLEHLGGKMLFDEAFTPPDVIVSDVRMPGVSGLSVLEGVRQRGWKTPVVLITAFGDEDVRAKAARLDATVLSKPIDLDRLQIVLSRSA